MPTIGELKTIISAQTAQFDRSMRKVRSQLKAVQAENKKMRSEMGRGATTMRRAAGSAAALAASYLTVRGAVVEITKALKLAASEQSASVVFDAMFGGGAGGNLTGQLRQFAIETPFQLTELRDGAKLLAAYVDSVDDVVPKMRMLGDLAAGTGTNFMELARAWARNSQLQRIVTRDVREFTNRGIAVDIVMARMAGETWPEFNQRLTDGGVAFTELNAALELMASSQGKFGGLMEQQSKTLGGSFSNMGDAIDNLRTDLGNLAAAQFSLNQNFTDAIPILSRWSKALRGALALQAGQAEVDTSSRVSTLLLQNQAATSQLQNLQNTPLFMRGKDHRKKLEVAANLKSMSDQALKSARSGVRRDLANKAAEQKRSLEEGTKRPPGGISDFDFMMKRARRKIGAGLFRAGSALGGSASDFRRGAIGSILSGPGGGGSAGGGFAAPRATGLAGAAARGSGAEARILQQAKQKDPIFREATKHTTLLKDIRGLLEIGAKAGAERTGGVIADLTGGLASVLGSE